MGCNVIYAMIINTNYSTFGETIRLREIDDCEGIKLYKTIDEDGRYTINYDEDKELMDTYTENEFIVKDR